MTVSAEVVRPGRTVELLSASLADERGELIRASAWRIAARGVDLLAELASEDPASPARGEAPCAVGADRLRAHERPHG